MLPWLCLLALAGAVVAATSSARAALATLARSATQLAEARGVQPPAGAAAVGDACRHAQLDV